MISWTLFDIACFSSTASVLLKFKLQRWLLDSFRWKLHGTYPRLKVFTGTKKPACSVLLGVFLFPDELMRSFFCRVANHASVAFTPMFQQKTIKRSPKKPSRFTGPVAVRKALYRHCPFFSIWNLRSAGPGWARQLGRQKRGKCSSKCCESPWSVALVKFTSELPLLWCHWCGHLIDSDQQTGNMRRVYLG